MRIEELVGKRIKEARERRKWTQAELGERLTKGLGRPLSRQAVSLAEMGRRDFGVADLLGFAQTLGVKPMSLLNPTFFMGEQISVGKSTLSALELLELITAAGEADVDLTSDELMSRAVKGFAKVLGELETTTGEMRAELDSLRDLEDQGYGFSRIEQK